MFACLLCDAVDKVISWSETYKWKQSLFCFHFQLEAVARHSRKPSVFQKNS